MTIDRRALDAAAAAVEALQERRRQAPLAHVELWDPGDPNKTSQRRTVRDILTSHQRVNAIFGGNRAGKTVSGCALAMAAALGLDHPHTRAFLARNAIPAELVTRIRGRMGKVLCVSLTNGESNRVQRPGIANLAPPGARWSNQYGSGEAQVVLPGGRRNGNGSITFKTVDQGARSFQADSFDLIWFDEDPEDEAVWNEALMRIIDRKGWVLHTMSPIRSGSFMVKKVIKQAQTLLRYLWGEHNPHITPEELRAVVSNYSAAERAARERGEVVAVEGRVYPEYRRDVHVRPPPEDLEGLVAYGSIDFGTRNPFCYLLGLLDRRDDTLYVVAEHYKRQTLLSQHAQHIRAMEQRWIPRTMPELDREKFAEWAELAAVAVEEGTEAPEMPFVPVPEVRWADPEDRQSRLSLGAEHGIDTVEAQKAIRRGINAVAERLAPDVAGRPHLFISPECANLLEEIESYVWADSDQKDTPKKHNDHAMDALRYLCEGIRRLEGWGG